ncbi:MAG: efflux RND transporter periplasmic adaptor subunit [Verrucomicrobia bacterium]|nr:efflux RND transporter periplasmic adaptor subunit [Verrucomicrobiota bacterium]
MKFFNLTSGGRLAALLLVLALPCGCSRKEKTKTAPPVPVLTSPTATKTIPSQLTAVGNVLPVAKVTVRSQITGRLEAVHFQEGRSVRQGDLLFTIDPRPAQAALARDQAQLENAQIQFARAQKLYDQKLIPQEEYDTSRAARDTLAATVQADELNLAYCEIRAPMDGVTGAQLAFPGNIVKSPDDALLLINQIHPIYVAFAVPERFLPPIKNEMAAHALKTAVNFAGLTGAAPQGEVTFVDNTVDPTTGTIQLRATFANDDGKLWPGQFVEVTLTLSEIANAVVVASQAVQTGQNGQYVFVVKADQTVELRPVQTGDTTAGETVVTGGLRAGETVVTDGQLRLVPGTKVNAKASIGGSAATNAP